MVHLSRHPNMTSLLRYFLGLVSLSYVMAHPWPPGPDPDPPRGNMSIPGHPAEDTDAYCEMLVTNPVGIDIPWFCVCSRCKGTPGPKGDTGLRGLTGPPGSSGRRGLTGFRGRPGFTGRPGLKGAKGDEGLKGDRGSQGRMGDKGGRGFKGDKGDRGFEGPPGEHGARGDDGVCPQACDAAKGSPGQEGLVGPAGPRGPVGEPGPAGRLGSKGEMGEQGDAGEQGPTGLKGDQGEEGMCNCTDGVDGSDGGMGDKGDKGDMGSTGGQGQKGDTGLMGDKGDDGFPGPPGPCTSAIQSAFSVALTTPFPAPSAPVLFPGIIYNRQNHYDPATGIYTAPVNGTYVFSYHFTVYQRILKVGLFHNHMPVVIVTETAELSIASHQLILRLAAHDRVWIQVRDVLSNGMFVETEASSTFSGFLLHPERCDMPMFRGGPVDLGPPGPPPVYSWPTPPANSTV